MVLKVYSLISFTFPVSLDVQRRMYNSHGTRLRHLTVSAGKGINPLNGLASQELSVSW